MQVFARLVNAVRAAGDIRFGTTFLMSAIACVAFCVVAGSTGHLFAATFVSETYVLAIGDHVLPSSPVESMVLGPLIIGAFVSWWFGLAMCPVVYLVAGGPNGNWRLSRITVAGSVSMVVSATALLIASRLGEGWRDGFALALFMAELDFGYTILGIGLVVMGLLIRTPRRNSEVALTSFR